MELIQYFVVNKDLNMSTGKIAGQVAHVETEIIRYLENKSSDEEYSNYGRWYYDNNQTKVILKAKEKDLLKLIDQGWFFIHDNGKTEIPEGSLTVVGCLPNYKDKLQKLVKRFQLL